MILLWFVEITSVSVSMAVFISRTLPQMAASADLQNFVILLDVVVFYHRAFNCVTIVTIY